MRDQDFWALIFILVLLGFVSLWLYVALIAIIVAVVLYNLAKDKKNALFKLSKTEFSSPNPDDVRFDFLKRTIGLDKHYCDALHFDGFTFMHETQINYAKYTGVAIVRKTPIVTNDSSLPHKREWIHQCVDGSPDLRFRGNYQQLRTIQVTTRFLGESFENIVELYDMPPDYPGSLHPSEDLLSLNDQYGYPCIENTVKALIRLFSYHDHELYERAYAQFRPIYLNRCDRSAQLATVRKRMCECEAVISAYKELSQANSQHSTDLNYRVTKARAELCTLSAAELDICREVKSNIEAEEKLIKSTVEMNINAARVAQIAAFSRQN